MTELRCLYLKNKHFLKNQSVVISNYESFTEDKTPLLWKKILHDEYVLSDALSFKKWDKNLDFPTSKLFFS